MVQIKASLAQGEKIIYGCKSSWAVFLIPTLWFFVTMYFAYVVKHNFFVQVAAIATILVTAVSAVKFVIMDYAVSDQKLWLRTGIHGPQLLGVPHDELKDMKIEQSSFGLFFDYGKVTVVTSQGEVGPFSHVENPTKLRETLENLNVLEPLPEPIKETRKERKLRLKREKAERNTKGAAK